MNAFKGVGFDLDNTLYVQTPEMNALITDYLVSSVAERLGRPVADVKSDYLRLFSELQSARRSLMQMGIPDGRDYVQEALENADIASKLQPDTKLAGMLERLADKYALFLVTGSRGTIAEGKLSALGVDRRLFSSCFYADNRQGVSREDGSLFRYWADGIGCGLEGLAFVGDREKVDIIPASRLGVTTFMVNGRSDHATYNLKDIYELEKHL